MLKILTGSSQGSSSSSIYIFLFPGNAQGTNRPVEPHSWVASPLFLRTAKIRVSRHRRCSAWHILALEIPKFEQVAAHAWQDGRTGG